MADLVSHVCVVLLPAALFPSRLAPVAAAFTVVPDALGRAVPLALERAIFAGWPVPPSWLWPWSALHEPVGWALVAGLVSLSFVERDRAAVLRAALVGGAAHTAVDVLQDHHGEGYRLLAPFSDRMFELGCIGSEATVPYAGWLAALVAVAWIPRWLTPGRGATSAAAAANVGALAVIGLGWFSG